MTRTDLEPFEYGILAPDVRELVQEHTSEIRTLARRAAQDIVEIGERLKVVREALDYGQFDTWVKAEFGWGRAAAYRFIQVADSFSCLNLGQVDIAPSALYALASGTTPAPIREEFVQRAQAGEPVALKDVKARIVEHHQQYEPESPASVPPARPTPAPVVKAAPAAMPAPVKKPYTPLPRELENMELIDGTSVQVPKLPMLPMERELKEKNHARAAERFDSAASRLLAALTAIDAYSMADVQQIMDSPEGRQLFAPVRVARIRELLSEVHGKWVGTPSKGQVIEAEPLLEDRKCRTLDALN